MTDLPYESIHGVEDTQAKMICGQCVEDPWLGKHIETTGAEGTCSYCGQANVSVITIGELTELTYGALTRHYAFQTWNPTDGADYIAQKYGETDWEPKGEPIVHVIQELVECDDGPAEDIRAILYEAHDSIAPGEVHEEDQFEETSHWAEDTARQDHLFQDWIDMERSLQQEARLFNDRVQQNLKNVFEAADRLAMASNSSLTVNIGPGETIDGLWRGRVFYAEAELRKAMERPDTLLGPPPSGLAKAGRMNMGGISVFYGATEKALSLSEVRPPVGSKVLLARFNLEKPLKLLNVDAFSQLEASGSYFDASFKADQELVQFFKTFNWWISRAVLPDEEARDYIITQAISEYLAHKHTPRFDGIMYQSAQAGSRGHNIVLFHHVAKVNLLDLPEQGTHFLSYTSTSDENGSIDDYGVFVTVKKPEDKDSTFETFQTDTVIWPLSIDTSQMEVHYVHTVDIGTDMDEVSWDRRDEVVSADKVTIDPLDELPF